MPRVIGQPKPKMPAPDDLAVLELKANLNSEQREYLEVLKDKMKKTLAGKTKQELAKAGDLATLKNYKAILTEILEFLKTKEIKIQISEKTEKLEKDLNLREQYDEQFEILKDTGVIKKLKDGQWGMINILGQEQPIPSYQEIRERLNAKAEMLDKKRQQGFTKMLLVPIGMKLEDLVALAGKLILKKHQEGKLLAPDGTQLKLNEKQPVYLLEGYKNRDINGGLVYYPQKFDKDNHGGKTKSELVEENGGWQIILLEDLSDLPAKGKGWNINGRNQIESGKSPEEYLKMIQTDPQYANEKFTTPEAQLIYFMEYLHRNNRVIDDWEGKGTCCWNAGAYFKIPGQVPLVNFTRTDKQFRLYANTSDYPDDEASARSSVII